MNIIGSFYRNGRGQINQHIQVSPGPSSKIVRLKLKQDDSGNLVSDYELWINKGDILALAKKIQDGEI